MPPTFETRPPLLGVSIDGPPPLGAIDFPLYKGLTVLYGTNGVGKTKILKSLHQALAGQRVADTCRVHLRFETEDLTSPFDFDVREALLILIKRAIEVYATNTFYDEIVGLDVANTSVRDLVESILLASVTDNRPFIAEIVGQGRFSLTPTGQNSPSWDVWVSAVPSEDTPNLRWLVDQERRRDELLLDLGIRQTADSVTSDEIHAALEKFHYGQPREAEERGFVLLKLSEPLTSFQYRDRESWVPVPIEKVGRLELPVGFAMPLGEDEQAQQLSTRSLFLARTCKPLVEVASEDDVVPSPEAQQFLAQLSRDADSSLQRVLGDDAPVLQCRLEPWGVTPPLAWEASDRWSSSSIPISAVGSGRSRWAVMAAHLALSAMAARIDADEVSGFQVAPNWNDWVVLIDEPELGLHPMAEQTMFAGLKQWGYNRSVIAATHSAVAFRDPDVRLVHVDRDEGGLIVCRAMEPALQNLLQPGASAPRKGTSEHLGLQLADVLQFFRRFVIVEGEHDLAVIEAAIGTDELFQARSRVLPMRGTNNLMSVLGAQLIFDYTTADVLVVLDRTNGPHFEEIWNRARELHDSGNQGAAFAELRELEGHSKEEQKLSFRLNPRLPLKQPS